MEGCYIPQMVHPIGCARNLVVHLVPMPMNHLGAKVVLHLGAIEVHWVGDIGNQSPPLEWNFISMWYGGLNFFCNLITSTKMHLGLRACRPLSHNITKNNRLPSKKKFVITFDLRLGSCVGHGLFKPLFVELPKGI